jgi:hypothetical protein
MAAMRTGPLTEAAPLLYFEWLLDMPIVAAWRCCSAPGEQSGLVA